MSKTIYGAADVARMLEVTRSAVANYQARHDDTPPPAFTTPDGRPFWDEHGMALWHVWHGAMKATGPDRYLSTDERLSRAQSVVAGLGCPFHDGDARDSLSCSCSRSTV